MMMDSSLQSNKFFFFQITAFNCKTGRKHAKSNVSKFVVLKIFFW